MALPSSGYLGQWFSTKQLFLKFSRIFRRPASGKRGRILIKVQVISLLSDITDRLARAFFSCVLSGNSSENEYVQKRITAHAVGTVNTSCDFTGSIQTRNRSSCCIQNLRFGVGIEAAHRVVDCHSGITSPEGTLSNFSGQIPRSLMEVRVFFILNKDVVIAINSFLKTFWVNPIFLASSLIVGAVQASSIAIPRSTAS